MIFTKYYNGDDIHVSLDLETLDTKCTAQIIAIGAVATKLSGEIVGEFYASVTSQDAVSGEWILDERFTSSEDTIEWWKKPENQTAKDFMQDHIADLEIALHEFSKWVKYVDSKYVWGNGSDFDISILKNAFDVCKMEWPFKFYNHRDLRTLLEAANIDKRKFEMIGTKHVALDDARFQAELIGYAYEKLHTPWWKIL